MMDSLTHVVEYTTSDEQRAAIRRQADMIMRAAENEVTEPNDLEQVRERFERLVSVAAARHAARSTPAHPSGALS
jgi:uncharacterized membrane protein